MYFKSFVNLKTNETKGSYGRRYRLHEILIALINQQNDLELMDDDAQLFNKRNYSEKYDPSEIVERNQRIIKKYQSLVRSAIALDALLESEECDICD